MTKEEVYKSIIDIQKKTGQGLSGIVRVKSPHFSKYIPELIEEGLVKACDTGGSLGHPESNIFYVPTKGYNVWEDENDNDRLKGKNLQYVRFYLGCFNFKERESTGDEQEDLKRLYLDPTMFDCIRNPDWMEGYVSWLKVNKEELEIMRTLDDYYESPTIEFTDEEIQYITTRSWYKNNKTISECMSISSKFISKLKENISINKKLVKLYSENYKKYSKKLTKCEKDIDKSKKIINQRKKIHRWFSTQDGNGNIQELFMVEEG